MFSPLVDFHPGTEATAEDQNAQDTDIADGLTQCLTRAGLAPATADIDFGGFKLLEVAPGSDPTDGVNFGQLSTIDELVNLHLTGFLTVDGVTTLNGAVVTNSTIAADDNILMEGTGAIKIANGGTAFRPASPITGMMRYNTATNSFEGYTDAGWVTWGGRGAPPPAPAGRLTLTTGTPVLSAPVLAGTTIRYTPYNGSVFPTWNGTIFSSAALTELSQALSDTTVSPAAAVAASVYDMFVWMNGTTLTLSRGPAWSNTTTRGYSLSLVLGVYVNGSSITNGPAAGYGVYVGTIATDAGGATCTFNPVPVAAAGGGNAWIGIWNNYNRVTGGLQSQDNTTSWGSTGTTWTRLNASASNRLTFVNGLLEDSTFYAIAGAFTTASANGAIGAGFGGAPPTISAFFGSGTTVLASASASGVAAAPVGVNFIQGLQNGTATFYGIEPTFSTQANVLSATVRY